MRLRLGAIALITLAAAACTGTRQADPPVTDAARRAVAEDFAVSARRALTGTRFEPLEDAFLVDLLLEVCDALPDAGDPDAVVADALDRVEAPAGEAGDDRILLEVVAAGLAETCPEEVLAAAAAAAPAGDPVDAFMGAVAPAAEEALGDSAPGGDRLVAAGAAVCAALDAGGAPPDGGLAALAVLFGVSADTLAEAEGSVSLEQATVAGAVLGAAATYLCPEHLDAVMDYVAG